VASFDGNELVLDHGSVSVDTSQAFAVRVGCLHVIPVRLDGTQYDVTSADGKVTVTSRKSDVNVNHTNEARKNENRDNPSGQATVREGEQQTWNDKCAAAALAGQGATAGLKGPILDSAWVKGAGGAAIAGLACWVLCRHDDPISPNVP
jgi:ferric-dicitrate binding protein FerR (iron transport regulator)